MAKSVWVVSADEVDSHYALAVFSSRKKMIKALKSKFPDVEIHYSGDLPFQASYSRVIYDKTFYETLALDRFKLDDGVRVQ